MMKPYRQPTRMYRLQHRAHSWNGNLAYKVAEHHREWKPSCQAWPGPNPAVLRRRPREFGELVIPTQEIVADTTTTTIRTTAIWWGWVVSSEPAKCRTLATASTSSSAKVAEKTHRPSTPGVLIVLDEWVARSDTHSKSFLMKPIYPNKCYW